MAAMKLLNLTTNKPYNKDGIQLLRDLCCLYIDTNLEIWQLSLNDYYEENSNFVTLKDALRRLAILIDKKNRNQSDRKIIIFTNRLGFSMDLLINLIGEELENSYYNKTKRGQYIASITTKHFIIRNFSVLTGKVSDIWDINEKYEFDSKKEVDIMKNFINFRFKQGFTLKTLDKSFANCTQKAFYKRFSLEEKKELIKDINNNRRAASRTVFKDLMMQTNCGIMNYRKDFKEKILHNVIAFDISSSYPSQFIKGNDFPIGHITHRETNLAILKKLINEDKWFLAVFSSTECYNDTVLKAKKIDDKYWYFINKYDYKCMRLLDKKFNNYNLNLERLLSCDKEGYLNETFRKKLHECYLEKEQAKGGRRYQLKTEIDTLYGKGIQERDIDEINPISYYRNEEHYICPQFSFHALSRARFELLSMICSTDIDLWVASDTDCIKTMDRKIYEIIEKRNKEIIEENRCAGFDSNCGIWKFEGEYDNFIQYCNKVYAYSYNGKIECTFAGCLESAWKEFFRDKTVEEGIEILSKDFEIPNGRKVALKNKETKKCYFEYRNWSLLKEE